MNPADLALGLALVVLIVMGLNHGLLGLILLGVTTILSLCIAGAVAVWVGAGSGLAGAPGLLVIPATFFASLWIGGALLRSIANAVRREAHRSPVAVVDRMLGAVVAAGLGVVLLSLIVFAALVVPIENPVSHEVESSAAAPWLLDAGSRMMNVMSRPLPMLEPIAERLAEAGERLKAPVETRAPGEWMPIENHVTPSPSAPPSGA